MTGTLGDMSPGQRGDKIGTPPLRGGPMSTVPSSREGEERLCGPARARPCCLQLAAPSFLTCGFIGRMLSLSAGSTKGYKTYVATMLHSEALEMAANLRRIGPNMARIRLRQIDGRSELGRLWRNTERELTESIGGNPTPGEAILIASASDMVVRTSLLSEQVMTASTPEVALEAERRAAWWTERLRRTLVSLGLERRAPRSPTLPEHIAAHYPSTAP